MESKRIRAPPLVMVGMQIIEFINNKIGNMITQEMVPQLQKLTNAMKDALILLGRLWEKEKNSKNFRHYEIIIREEAEKADPTITFLNAIKKPFGFTFSMNEQRFAMTVTKTDREDLVGVESLEEQQ